MKKITLLIIFLFSIAYQNFAIYRDSVIVLISKRGYEVDVIKPGTYVVVSNFSGKKVEGRVRILSRRILIVGHTVVPINHIKKITVKSSMYPISKGIYNAGKFLLIKVPGKLFNSVAFSTQGPAALLIFIIAVVVAIVLGILGLLIMLVALPGLIVGKTYSTRYWKIVIKPRR